MAVRVGNRPEATKAPARVNAARCEGHGLCEGIAPAAFFLPDEGPVELVLPDGPIPEELEEAMHRASRSCPVAAIEVESRGDASWRHQ